MCRSERRKDRSSTKESHPTSKKEGKDRDDLHLDVSKVVSDISPSFSSLAAEEEKEKGTCSYIYHETPETKKRLDMQLLGSHQGRERIVER